MARLAKLFSSLRLRVCAAGVVVLVGLGATVEAQDNTTLLALFLRDLRAGTLGTLTSISRIRVGDGLASAPSISFATFGSDDGMYHIGDGIVGFATQALGRYALNGANFQLGSNGTIGWTGTANDATQTVDVSLSREAAGHLFQRNSTNAQRASWANTYTSATNYEAFSVDWQTAANVALVGTRTAATGTSRGARFVSQDNNGADSWSWVEVKSNTLPFIRLEARATAAGLGNTTNGAGNFVQIGGAGGSTASSGQVNFLAVLPVVNQSGTGAHTDLLINRTETAVGSGAQVAIDVQTGGTSRFSVAPGGASGRGTMLAFTQSTAPTCSSNCGTSPSVSGSDTAGRVTMGSSGVPASGWVVTLNGTYSTAGQCNVWMSKAGMVVGKMPLTVVTTTTTFTVVTNGTAPSTTDTYDYECRNFK